MPQSATAVGDAQSDHLPVSKREMYVGLLRSDDKEKKIAGIERKAPSDMSDRDEFERERLVALIIDVGMMRRDVASDVAAAILDRWHLASKVEDAVWKQAYETDIASNFITKDELAALAAMSDSMENYPYVSEGTLKAPAIAQRGHAIIDYTNWRNERSTREIVPLGNWKLCSNEWHPDEQWMMLAHDVAKGEDRWFALSGIHSWQKK